MRIHPSPYYGKGQHSGADFMIHPNNLHTWDLLKHTRAIKFLPIQMDWIVGSKVDFFFFNIKSLNLWAVDEGVRDMGLTPNLIYGPIQDVFFHPPKSHDQWGPTWAH